MSPALNIDDAFTVDPFEYESSAVARFDIVVFQAPEEVKQRTKQSGDVRLVKRVVGLPGEKIQIKENQVFINGELLVEPYEILIDAKDPKRNFGPITIPRDEYFLMGDNRVGSEDSRWHYHPTIKKSDIHSKVIKVLPGYYKK